MKTLAAILVEQKQPLVIDEVEVPALQIGQVLVKVVCSGICGSQLGEIDGVKGPDKFLPHLLGHEGGGSVLETGPGVTRVKVGDRVVLHWRKSSGMESAAPRYGWNGKTVNAGWVTTFNSHAVVSENRLTKVADDLDYEVAALMGCAVTTGLGVVVNNAGLRIGESILVLGAGGVGLSVIQGAALTSAYPIIAVDVYDNRLALAKSMGATHIINGRQDDLRGSVRQIVGESGAEVVVETTGRASMIEVAYELSGPTGRVVLVGVPKKGENISIYTLPLHFGKSIIGSHGGEANPQTDIPRYCNLYRAGKLSLKQLISDRFSLDEINTAISRMRDGSIPGRCMILMSSSGREMP